MSQAKTVTPFPVSGERGADEALVNLAAMQAAESLRAAG